MKAQSAIEYLMTYGWMLLVVAIAGEAIFSIVSGQNIESVTGFESSHFNVQDFSVAEGKGRQFVVQDSIGQTKINNITLSSSEVENVTYTMNQNLNEHNVVSLPGTRPSDENEQLDVEIRYDSGNLKGLTSEGQVQGRLDISNNFEGKEILLDDLLGYWYLDPDYVGDDKIFDLSGNQNHGQIVGEPEFDESNLGDGLSFNGDDEWVGIQENYYSTGDGWSGQITIGAWVKTNSEKTQHIIASGSSRRSFYLRTRDDGAQTTFHDGDTWNHVTTSEVLVNDGDWHHIMGSYDGDVSTLYVNGEKRESEELGISVPRLRVEAVGSFHTSEGATANFEGTISSPVLYDRALSEDEVKVIYQNGR